MTKAELIKELKEQIRVQETSHLTKITEDEVNLMVKLLTEIITNTVCNGDSVTLPTLGKFDSKLVAEKTGTVTLPTCEGKQWTKPAHYAPTFKISKTLKDALLEVEVIE